MRFNGSSREVRGTGFHQSGRYPGNYLIQRTVFFYPFYSSFGLRLGSIRSHTIYDTDYDHTQVRMIISE
jgi:hypothetical protein